MLAELFELTGRQTDSWMVRRGDGLKCHSNVMADQTE